MRIPIRFAVGALALGVACLGTPTAAFAGASWNSGHSGANTVNVPPMPGYAWGGLRPTADPTCLGTEPEVVDGWINAGEYNKVITGPGTPDPMFTARFFRRYESYQYLISNPAITQAGRAHCLREVQVIWTSIKPNLSAKSGLAGQWGTVNIVDPAPVPLPEGVDAFSAVKNAVSFTITVPRYNADPSYQFQAKAALQDTDWATADPKRCPTNSPSLTSVKVKFDAASCSITASTRWTFSAGRLVNGAFTPVTITTTTSTFSADLPVQAREIGSVYTDGSTTIEGSNGKVTGPDLGLHPGESVSADGSGYTGTSSGLEGADTAGSPRQGTNGKTGAAAGRTGSAQNVPSSDGSSGASRSGAHEGSGFDMKLGGVGIGLLIVAILAIGGFVFFGRRHRL